MPEYSLINPGGLTKPVTVLIEKISNAVGTLWEPKQIRRVAQAEADAAMILASRRNRGRWGQAKGCAAIC